MYYIVGLGNPGEEYIDTRHNVGRTLVERFAHAKGFSSWNKSKGANALTADGVIGTHDVTLLLPETFMNLSGQSVHYMCRKHAVDASQVIVVYDDVDVPLGELKISKGRGDGGHNGVASMIKSLGTKDFIRVRVGIAGKSFWTGETKRPTGGHALNKHVLGRFSKGDKKTLDAVYERAQQGLETIVTDGIERAMNQCN